MFAVTVNPEGGSLKDATGGRRFWAVMCGATWADGRVVDVDRLVAVRDQLWAEAQTRYKAGEAWHMDDPELDRAAKEAAEDRYDADVWSTVISSYLEEIVSDAVDDAGQPNADPPRVQVTTILSDVLRLDISRWTRLIRCEFLGSLQLCSGSGSGVQWHLDTGRGIGFTSPGSGLHLLNELTARTVS